MIQSGSYGVVYKVAAITGYETPNHVIEKGDVFAMKKYTNIKDRQPWDFIKEVDIVNRIKHKNIIGSIDVFKDNDGELCVVFPLACSDWRNYIPSNHWTLKNFHQMLSGLNHLHSNSIIHGDIKPENILVFTHGQKNIIKLADFGVSTIIHDDTSTSLQSPPYKAPELHKDKGKKHSFESDMWSVGVVLCEAIMGVNRLFYGVTSGELINSIDLFFDSDRWRIFSLSGPINYLVSKMLDRNPHTRITVEDALKNNIFSQFTYRPGEVVVPPEEKCIHVLSNLRERVVKWMFDLSVKMDMNPQSIYVSINLYDRYLNTRSGNSIKIEHLQLVACAAVSITLKLLEETFPPTTQYIYESGNVYDVNQIIYMEYKIMKHVDWILYRPTILTMLNHIPKEQLEKYYAKYSTSNEIIQAYDQDQISEVHEI